MTPEQASALRAPFPPEAIGKIPKGGTFLDYCGHAAVTDRLLAVDPDWTWKPAAFDEAGAPLIVQRGQDSTMWIRLTVCGVTRLGVGIVASKSFELEKQLISDAIRNAAMRFGVALDLWSKEDLHANENAEGSDKGQGVAPTKPARTPERVSTDVGPSAALVASLKARAIALNAGDRVAELRQRWNLPLIADSDAKQLELWGEMLREIETEMEASFVEVPA